MRGLLFLGLCQDGNRLPPTQLPQGIKERAVPGGRVFSLFFFFLAFPWGSTSATCLLRPSCLKAGSSPADLGH